MSRQTQCQQNLARRKRCVDAVRGATVGQLLDRYTNAGRCMNFSEPLLMVEEMGNRINMLKQSSVKNQEKKLKEKKADCNAGVNSFLAHPGYGNHPVFGKTFGNRTIWSLLSGKRGRERVRRARINAEFNRGVATYRKTRN